MAKILDENGVNVLAARIKAAQSAAEKAEEKVDALDNKAITKLYDGESVLGSYLDNGSLAFEDLKDGALNADGVKNVIECMRAEGEIGGSGSGGGIDADAVNALIDAKLAKLFTVSGTTLTINIPS